MSLVILSSSTTITSSTACVRKQAKTNIQFHIFGEFYMSYCIVLYMILWIMRVIVYHVKWLSTC